MNKKLIIEKDNERLDVYISGLFPEYSRNKVSKLISIGNIKVNNTIVKPSFKAKIGDVISIYIDEDIDIIKPEDISINIVKEDEYYTFINKDKGIVVHPCENTKKGTLVSALLFKYGLENLSNINGIERPGIVHRLDKDTSGIMCICKTNDSHIKFAELIKERKIEKVYYGIVDGKLLGEGTINKKIGRDKKNRTRMAITKDGRDAITHYKSIKIINNRTIVRFKIETGRTHQIRVHMKYIGFPLTGDLLYGKKSSLCKGQALHAYKLSFIHPYTYENTEIIADLPDYMKSYFNDVTL